MPGRSPCRTVPPGTTDEEHGPAPRVEEAQGCLLPSNLDPGAGGSASIAVVCNRDPSPWQLPLMLFTALLFRYLLTRVDTITS